MPTCPPTPPKQERPRRTGPDAEIRRARKLAVETEEVVKRNFEKRSKALLEKFLRLPEQQRLEGMNSDALTDEDRKTLQLSFGHAPARRRSQKWSGAGSASIVRAFGRSRQHVGGAMKFAAVALAVGVPALVAWRNTAAKIILHNEIVLRWEGPEHRLRSSSTEEPGGAIYVVQRSDGFFVRKWEARTGYVYAPINFIGVFDRRSVQQ